MSENIVIFLQNILKNQRQPLLKLKQLKEAAEKIVLAKAMGKTLIISDEKLRRLMRTYKGNFEVLEIFYLLITRKRKL